MATNSRFVVALAVDEPFSGRNLVIYAVEWVIASVLHPHNDLPRTSDAEIDLADRVSPRCTVPRSEFHFWPPSHSHAEHWSSLCFCTGLWPAMKGRSSRRAPTCDGSRRESTEMMLASHIVDRTEYPFARKLLSAQRLSESIQ